MNKEFKLEELEKTAEEFLNFIENNKKRILGFSGNLGAGKTTFTKKLLEKMGYEGGVPSPTFVLRRDYEAGGKKVIHIDAYRLEKPEHLFQVISEEELHDPKNLVIIEWPEKVDKQVFDEVFTFEHLDENTRSISTK